MTVTSHPRTEPWLDAAPSFAGVPRQSDARLAWRVWGGVTFTIAAIYLLMYNPYWVPGGDSELYIALGRSWATGLRHQFNGQYVSISPPGWPLVLAAAMKILPTFGFLKLITITCMTLSLGLWYWVLLRFMPIRQAAMLTLLTASISHVYSLSFWMHSDALFCLLSTGAMVVAFQIVEGRPHPHWRIALLIGLCAAAQSVRWAGMLQWIIAGGILLSGQPFPLNRSHIKELWGRINPSSIAKHPQWPAAILSLMVTLGTFWTLRHTLHLTNQQEELAKEAGATFDDQQTSVEARPVEIFNGKQSTRQTIVQEMGRRVRDAGKWFSWLLWPELRFAGGVKVMSSVDTVSGWALLIALAIFCLAEIRARHWIWAGVALYCAFLCIGWPNPNARYLVPILPLILWGVTEGIRMICQRFTVQRWGGRMVAALLASVAVANIVLLIVDIAVARSHEFYANYEAGLNQSLITAIQYLNAQGIKDGDLAISEKYENLGKSPRPSKAGLRAAVMLSNHVIKNVPSGSAFEGTAVKFTKWARKAHIQWYLYQEPISPWRVWHFRLPAWLQKSLSREEVKPESAGWVLYRRVLVSADTDEAGETVPVSSPSWVKVDVPPVHNWPTRVPGM